MRHKTNTTHCFLCVSVTIAWGKFDLVDAEHCIWLWTVGWNRCHWGDDRELSNVRVIVLILIFGRWVVNCGGLAHFAAYSSFSPLLPTARTRHQLQFHGQREIDDSSRNTIIEWLESEVGNRGNTVFHSRRRYAILVAWFMLPPPSSCDSIPSDFGRKKEFKICLNYWLAICYDNMCFLLPMTLQNRQSFAILHIPRPFWLDSFGLRNLPPSVTHLPASNKHQLAFSIHTMEFKDESGVAPAAREELPRLAESVLELGLARFAHAGALYSKCRQQELGLVRAESFECCKEYF